MMKKEKDVFVTIRFKESDYKTLKKEADERRMPLGTYIRMVLLSKKEGR